ncbi:MAG: ABC transporter substrate-binding protein [Gemmiger sp.]|nr:ABC transporter substrate-binding protein [Gemmiger sp.]
MKKATKQTASLLMAGAMTAALLAGCGGAPASTAPSSAATSEQTATPAASQDAATDLSKQEPYTVKILMLDDGNTDIVNEVAAAASEITLAKFNTTIELERVGWGSWAQQAMLQLTSGEKLDLLPAFSLNTSLANLVSNGYIVPMTDLLKDGPGAEMYAMVPEEDWLCDTVNGEIYGVPFNKGKQNVYGASCDTTYADELNIDLSAIKTLDDFEQALAKIKEAHPDIYPMATDGQKMRVMVPSDTLGDPREVVMGCLVDATSGSTTVENLYASDAYRDFVERMYDWQQKGYIMPDTISNTVSGSDLIRAGAFANFYTGPAPDTAPRLSRETGKPIQDVEFFEHYKTTGETSPCWSIAANSENPERAMQVLNEMYTNPELANIFIYGIEGKTYEFIDDSRTVIDYPAGVDASNAGYAFDHWAWPNMCLSYVWNGYPTDVYKQYETFNAGGVLSPAYGFTFDNSSVINEYTACTNVVMKYAEALNTGSLNPEGNLDKFNQELKENGIDTIIAAKQAQLDAWLAAK